MTEPVDSRNSLIAAIREATASAKRLPTVRIRATCPTTSGRTITTAMPITLPLWQDKPALRAYCSTRVLYVLAKMAELDHAGNLIANGLRVRRLKKERP